MITAVNSISLCGATLSVEGFSLGQPHVREGQLWAEILDVPKGTREIKVDVRVDSKFDEYVLAFQGAEPVDITAVLQYDLDVPVEWANGMPRTRAKNKDNVDIQMIATDGKVIDVQVSIVTRGGKFYLCAQELVVGQVGRTIGKKTDFVATKPAFAYHGFSFDGIWPNMWSGLSKLVDQEKASVQKSRIQASKWQSQELEPKTGWSRGNVLFWNLVTGLGRIQDVETGEVFFVHFSKVLEPATLEMPQKTAFVTLVPMQGVYYKAGALEAGKEHRSATAIFQPLS